MYRILPEANPSKETKLRITNSLSRQHLRQHRRLCTANSNSYLYLFLQDCPILAVNVAVVNNLFFSFSFFCTAVHEIECNTKETFCICNNEGPVTNDIKSSCIWKIRNFSLTQAVCPKRVKFYRKYNYISNYNSPNHIRFPQQEG